MQPITVRYMDFAIGEGLTRELIPGEPEESYANLALSLLLPHLEPYLIRTMREARPRLSSADLEADLAKFCAQEGQHYRQHKKLNDAVAAAAFAGLSELESELGRDYEGFSKARSLRFNLAYAEGFEAFTTATARFALEEGLLERMSPPARDLFSWHLVEELEHRTVAFDVYEAVFGGYAYRLAVGLFAQWHLLRFVIRASKIMIETDVEAQEKCGGEAGRKERMRRLGRLFARGLLPKVLATYVPWYSPHRIAMPQRAIELCRAYAASAVRITT